MTNRLATLNTLRTAAGKAPLKSWKESNAKLEAAIAALTPAAKLSEPAPVAKAEAKVQKKAAASYAHADRPLQAICKELNLNPKVARAKLRKAGLSAPYTDAKAIRKALA